MVKYDAIGDRAQSGPDSGGHRDARLPYRGLSENDEQ
jgi:hypothetical protein